MNSSPAGVAVVVIKNDDGGLVSESFAHAGLPVVEPATDFSPLPPAHHRDCGDQRKATVAEVRVASDASEWRLDRAGVDDKGRLASATTTERFESLPMYRAAPFIG